MLPRRVSLWAALLWMALPVIPARAGDFGQIVSRVESKMGIQRNRMPGVGVLVNSFMFIKRPAGSGHLNFAIFDNEERNGRLDPFRFQQTVQDAAGKGWLPLVRIDSRKSGESTGVYIRRSGSKFEMLVATCEHDEAVLVEMKLEGKKLLEWLSDPSRIGKDATEGIQ